MKSERIFVVVPVYKVEPFLERCISSILNQTCTNWELILVDDGSPDNCPAICDRYAAEYAHITVLHQENGGLSAARNAGIDFAMAHGDPDNDWIAFIDSDDFVHPKYLEYLYRAAKESGAQIIGCGFLRTASSDMDAEHALTFGFENLEPEEFWCRHYGEALVAWAKMYRLSLLGDIRYPAGKLNEDEYTTYKLVFRCVRISFVPLPMYYYYQNSTGIMHSAWTLRRLDGQKALQEQVAYFSRQGYQKAHEITSYYLIKRQISDLRAVEINHYDKSLQKTLKQELNQSLRDYGKHYGYRKAFKLWFSLRFMHRVRKLINRDLFRRVFSKLKRVLKHERSFL